MLLGLMAGNIFAQISKTPTGKAIAEMARKASYESPVSASGDGIKGTFTPAKISSDESKDLSNGAFIGLLDLSVSRKDFGKLRTGKFNLFLSGLRLYLEEKEKIVAVLEVTEQTPEGYKEIKSSDKSSLSFPSLDGEISGSLGLPSFKSTAIFSFSNKAACFCKIFIKIAGKWVWSGVKRRCACAKPNS